ncbi:MAG: sulfotransferase [Alphaproteobacteria bacterium]
MTGHQTASSISQSKPVFVGGFYKSGTSLLRALISQNSNIAGGLETYWFAVDWDAGKGRGDESLDAWLDRMAAFFSVDTAKVHEIAGKASSVTEFLDRFMTHVAEGQGKTRWVEKTSGNCLHGDRILSCWPDAKVINIYRDPRDAYAANLQGFRSKGEAPWVENNFVETWMPFITEPAAMREAGVYTRQNYLEIRYENLVLDIEGSMKRVARFIGEEDAESMSHFSGRKEDFEKVKKIAGKESTTLERLSQPLTRNRVGIWRDLPEQEIAGLEDAFRSAGIVDLYHAHCFAG